MKRAKWLQALVVAGALVTVVGCEQQTDLNQIDEGNIDGQDQQVEAEQEGVTVPGDVMTMPEDVRDEPPVVEPVTEQ